MLVETLPEELLDHILSYVTIDHHDRVIPDIQSLLNISRASDQLERMAEPYLHRVYDFRENDTCSEVRNGDRGPSLFRHTVEVHLDDNLDRAITRLKVVLSMPNVKILDITTATRERNYESNQLFRLPSLETIYVREFEPLWSSCNHERGWDFENPSVTTLHIQLVPLVISWWTKFKIPRLQALFPNLIALQFCGSSNLALNGETFRALMSSWNSSSPSNLKKLEYWHNDQSALDLWPLNQMSFGRKPYGDAAATESLHYLLPLELVVLKLDTSCLLPYLGEDGTVHLDLSNLPGTLHTLHIRHVVFDTDRLRFRENANTGLGDGETIPCLNHVLVEFSQLQQLRNLHTVKLLLFIPIQLADVAARMIRMHEKRIRFATEIVLA
jgi:hypothetical protein